MNRAARIEYYDEYIYPRVGGWLKREICHVISAVGDIQERNEVRGDIVEFGVYHGKFLLLIDALREAGERTVAVDLFEHQELSLHDWGATRASLQANIDLIPWSSSIEILCQDTMSLPQDQFSNSVRFFSVDADHAELNAFNDLVIAQEALVPGGIVAFDDFMHPCWSTATEGFYRFMQQANRRLKPLLYFKGKLFLTTAAEHKRLLSEYRDVLLLISPQALIKSICGHDCLIMSWDGY